jgi:hypothetical protein
VSNVISHVKSQKVKRKFCYLTTISAKAFCRQPRKMNRFCCFVSEVLRSMYPIKSFFVQIRSVALVLKQIQQAAMGGTKSNFNQSP